MNITTIGGKNYIKFLPYPSKEHNNQILQLQDRTLHVSQDTSMILQSIATSAITKGKSRDIMHQ